MDVEARATYGWRSGLFYWRLTTRGAGLHLAVEQRSRHPLRDLADTPRAELLQRRRTGRVMRLDAGSLGLSDHLVFKEDLYPLRSVLRSPFTRPRVLKEFEDLERLADRGLPTVDALACGWEGLWPFFRRTYLVTREFESAMSLRHWWRGGRDDSGALTLEEVVGLLGDLMPPLARLHNDGFWISTLRGKNILKHRTGRAQLVTKSLVAIPCYCLALPVMLVLGQDRFMKCSISLFDHLGRFLAFVGINPVSQRDI